MHGRLGCQQNPPSKAARPPQIDGAKAPRDKDGKAKAPTKPSREKAAHAAPSSSTDRQLPCTAAGAARRAPVVVRSWGSPLQKKNSQKNDSSKLIAESTSSPPLPMLKTKNKKTQQQLTFRLVTMLSVFLESPPLPLPGPDRLLPAPAPPPNLPLLPLPPATVPSN